MTRITRVVISIVLAIPAVVNAQANKEAAKKPARAMIYDIKADASEQVKAATALAHRDARRVLVMFGFNGCGWCHKLHSLFASDQAIRELLADEYVLAMVDIGSPGADVVLEDARAALSADELKKGVGFPFLAILDGDGKIVTAQRTDPLEAGGGHDPARVKAFLDKWVAPKVVASKVFSEGLAKASSEDKLVFLHFGSPTCGWCHKLDGFLARADMAPLISREFVNVKLDLSRMTGADEILHRFKPGASPGIPWFVFLDGKGQALATSDGPSGNIGYPVTPDEIAHFIGMLKKTARKLEPAQIDQIDTALKDAGKKIMAARVNK